MSDFSFGPIVPCFCQSSTTATSVNSGFPCKHVPSANAEKFARRNSTAPRATVPYRLSSGADGSGSLSIHHTMNVAREVSCVIRKESNSAESSVAIFASAPVHAVWKRSCPPPATMGSVGPHCETARAAHCSNPHNASWSQPGRKNLVYFKRGMHESNAIKYHHVSH